MNGSDVWQRRFHAVDISPATKIWEMNEIEWNWLPLSSSSSSRRRASFSWLIWSEHENRISIKYKWKHSGSSGSARSVSGGTSFSIVLDTTTTKNVQKNKIKYVSADDVAMPLFLHPEKKYVCVFFPFVSCIHYSMVVRRWRLMSFVSPFFSASIERKSELAKNIVFHSVRRQWKKKRKKRKKNTWRRFRRKDNTKQSQAARGTFILLRVWRFSRLCSRCLAVVLAFAFFVSLLKFSRNYYSDKQFRINIVEIFFLFCVTDSLSSLSRSHADTWWPSVCHSKQTHKYFSLHLLRLRPMWRRFFHFLFRFILPMVARDDAAQRMTLFWTLRWFFFSPHSSFRSYSDARIDSLQTNEEVSDSSLEMRTQR